MKIRTQLIISMVFFGLALAIISASLIATNQQVERLNKQEELARSIELKVGELNYLSNNYLLYHESQQTDRWESKYSSISADISNLTVDQPDQLVLLSNLKNSQQRLKEIFGDIKSRIESTQEAGGNTDGLQFVQTSGSRIGVQTQGMVFDASRLAQMLSQQAEETKQRNNLFIFALIGAFLAFLLTNYILINRRTLTSLSNLQAGAEIIGSGNLDYSIVERKGDEIGELALAFNKMTANLKTVTASKADLEREMAERKQAEEELYRSKELYRAIAQNFPNGAVYVFDRDLRFLVAEGEALEDIGWSREQLEGKSVYDLDEETRKIIEPRYRSVLAGQSLVFETPYRDRVIFSQYVPIRNDKREIFAGLVVGLDITERKQAEETLRESEERLRSLAENVPCVLMRFDRQLRVIYLSKQSDRYNPNPVERMIGRTNREMGMPEHLCDLWDAAIERVFGTGTQEEMEFDLAGPSGTRTFALTFAPEFGPDHEVRYVLGVSSDITERKRAEEERQRLAQELADRAAELQAVLNAAPVAVWIAHDPQCQRITGNAYADQILRAPQGGNVSRSALPGEAAVSYRVLCEGAELKPEEMPAQVATATGRPVMGDELELVFPDGRTVHLIESAVPLFDAEGQVRGAVIAGADVTQIKLAERALQKANDELEMRVQERTADLTKANAELIKARDAAEAAVEAKAAFLANMSHELRTPMNAVIGFSSLLLDDSLTPDQKDYVERIRIGGEALLALINDVLDFSKMEKSKVKIEHQPLSLRHCIEEALSMVAVKADERGLNLSCTISYGTPDAIIGDQGRLRQVLLNLLSNAVKFTDSGAVSVSVSSKALENNKQQILFAVRDTGIGIPEDKMEMLFLPFSQLEYNLSQKRDGTGLGLAISKSLVELMGGEIWAFSTPGEGSTFHFTIEAEIASGKAVNSVSTAKAAFENLAEKKPMRILVAEDVPSNQKVLVEMLKRMGYMADMAADGREVLQALELLPYDLILMDIQMPEMDGLEAARQIRKRWPTWPKIIAITAYAMEGDREKCLEAGMDDYIAKPVKKDDLVEALSHIYPPPQE